MKACVVYLSDSRIVTRIDEFDSVDAAEKAYREELDKGGEAVFVLSEKSALDSDPYLHEGAHCPLNYDELY